MMTKEELFKIKIMTPDREIQKQIKENWNRIAKPLDSMGKFESIIAQIGGIMGTSQVELLPRAVLVFCADNGVVEEGISQSGQEVTAAVAQSMLRGQSSVCKMAKVVHTDIKVIDIGINGKLKQVSEQDRYRNKKIAPGTNNFLNEPAMSEQETLQAIHTGIKLVKEYKEKGYRILAMGEMGIGNTTTSSAVAAALLDCQVEDITGRGAGLSKEGLLRKREVIKRGLEKYALKSTEPFTVLSSVGGLDIAGLVGMCIGGAAYQIPIIMDGVISMVAALVAERMIPGVKEYLIPSHKSKEPAVEKIIGELGVSSIIDADMALGEGTGAVMMFALLDMALSVYSGNNGFEDIGIERYRHFT